jgi:vacuolar protein sorting-associated protein 35
MDFDDQEKYLEDARRVVKEQAYFMKKALDQANLRDALRFSSTMLSELRTTLLSPRTYYILFMQVFDELRVLEQYFKEEYRRGRKMIDLYESVQHAQSIIPRLYLLVTVGSVYIQTQEVKAREILSDLLEMIKGV